MKYILTRLDSFSVWPGFIINGNLDYKTIFGGCITVIILIASFIFGVFFAEEIWEKQNPTVSSSIITNDHPGNHSYPEQIFFLMALRDKYDNPLMDETYFYPIARTWRTPTDKTIIATEKCSIVLKNNNCPYKNLINKRKLDLDKFYCLSYKYNNTGNISINEFWENDGFQMLQIKLYKCDNSTSKNRCKSDKEIRELISNSSVQVYSIKNNINAKNHKNPINSGIVENFYDLNDGFQTTVFHYIREIEIQDDNGIIFKNVKKTTSFTTDKQEHQLNQEIHDGKFFSFAIQLTNTKEIYTRSYTKIQDVGAQMGTFYSVFTVIGGILLKYFQKNTFRLDLLNDLFKITDGNQPPSNHKFNVIE